MASVVDIHPERQKIIDSILAGKTLREIATSVTPHVSVMAIQRYRAKVVAPAMANAAVLSKVLHGQGINPVEALRNPGVMDVTRAALAAGPYLQRMSELDAERAEVKKEARTAKDLRTWSALDRNDITSVQVTADLAGVTGNAGVTVNNNFVLVSADQQQRPIEATFSVEE